MNWVLSATPSLAALRFDSATMFGSYSIPRARAPRFAAAMTVGSDHAPSCTQYEPGGDAVAAGVGRDHIFYVAGVLIEGDGRKIMPE